MININIIIQLLDCYNHGKGREGGTGSILIQLKCLAGTDFILTGCSLTSPHQKLTAWAHSNNILHRMRDERIKI